MLERLDGQDGTENLLLDDAIGLSHTGDHGRGEEEAPRADLGSARPHLGVGWQGVDVRRHLGEVPGGGAAEANGGRLELDTRPGRGCTVRLLPPKGFVAVLMGASTCRDRSSSTGEAQHRTTGRNTTAAARLQKTHCVLLPSPDVGR